VLPQREASSIPTPSGPHVPTFSQYALNLTIESLPVSEVLQRSAMGFLRYYDHVVASIMPWMDGPDNMWRTAIIPLALDNNTLLYALLALAEEHHMSKQSLPGRQHKSESVSIYRDISLKHLARDLEDMTRGQMNSSKEATLAATLLLCQLEMVRSDAILWSLHWSAMKTIVQACTTAENSLRSTDGTACFLLKEVFVYDAFASTTMFDTQDVLWCPPPTGLDDEFFIKYLSLVQRVTITERRGDQEQYQQQVDAADLNTVDSIRSSFADARRKSLRAVDAVLSFSIQQRKNLNNLVELYHHSGILYALQALLAPIKTRADRAIELQQALSHARRLQHASDVQHDLVWPLFVIGTEGRGNPEVQTFVEYNLLGAMDLTAFRNCHAALDFLRGFWASAEAATWISYARCSAQSGTSFVVI
jgi:hypothetical protein